MNSPFIFFKVMACLSGTLLEAVIVNKGFSLAWKLCKDSQEIGLLQQWLISENFKETVPDIIWVDEI
jgi:hypothetical protein